MHSFILQYPTKVLFGSEHLSLLGNKMEKIGKSALLVYDRKTKAKNTGYRDITGLLADCSIDFQELGGARPEKDDIEKGRDLVRKHKLDFVIACGGSDIIYCAKAIAASSGYNKDPWTLFKSQKAVQKTLPVVTIPTTIATGTEINDMAIIHDRINRETISIRQETLKPRLSFINPAYTTNLPESIAASGIAEVFARILERYLSDQKSYFVQDSISESLMKTCISFGPLALKEPDNIEARANLMWASILSLDGFIAGNEDTHWPVLDIEYELYSLFQTNHGASLAVLLPHWMEYTNEHSDKYNNSKYNNSEAAIIRMARYAENIWNITDGDEELKCKKGIIQTRDFFIGLGLPETLSQIDITRDTFETIAENIISKNNAGNTENTEKDDSASSNNFNNSISKKDIIAVLEKSCHPELP